MGSGEGTTSAAVHSRRRSVAHIASLTGCGPAAVGIVFPGHALRPFPGELGVTGGARHPAPGRPRSPGPDGSDVGSVLGQAVSFPGSERSPPAPAARVRLGPGVTRGRVRRVAAAGAL